MTYHLPSTFREKWLQRVSMSLSGRNCWALSYRGAFLAATRTHNSVFMIMNLTFSPTTFNTNNFPAYYVAVASKTNQYCKTRLTNDVHFFPCRKWKMCRLRPLPLQFLLVGSRMQYSWLQCCKKLFWPRRLYTTQRLFLLSSFWWRILWPEGKTKHQSSKI